MPCFTGCRILSAPQAKTWCFLIVRLLLDRTRKWSFSMFCKDRAVAILADIGHTSLIRRITIGRIGLAATRGQE